MIKEQYKKVSEVFKNKVAEMRDQIAREETKTSVLVRRRACEQSGVASDLQNMKRKVEFYQKYINKLKQLVIEEASQQSMDDVYNQIKEEASEMEQSPEQPPF